MGSTDTGWIWITNGMIVTKGYVDKLPPGFYPGRGNWNKRIPRVKNPLEAEHRSMVSRCYYPKNKMYYRYGGRTPPEVPITVCDRWRNSREDFIHDVEKEIGPRPSGLTLSGKRSLYVFDRIDNDRNYEPGNIKWSTWKESNDNRAVSLRITETMRNEMKVLLTDKVNTYEVIAKKYGVSTGFVAKLAREIGIQREAPKIRHTEEMYERVYERVKVLLCDPKNTHKAVKLQIKQEFGTSVNVDKLAKQFQIVRWTREQVIDALVKSHGMITEAAKLLGCNYETLGRIILKRLGIDKKQYKKFHRKVVDGKYTIVYED
jgi:hypothetical protein